MRLRRALWRHAGPVLGSLAPGPARRYYDAVVASLVRALLRSEGVLAVYGGGSLVRGELEPGRSDVDLVVVVEDDEPAALAARWPGLRGVYGRRQAVLPIDVFPCARSELDRCGGWLAFVRPLLAGGWRVPPADWRLLGGVELRTPAPWTPESRLAYLTDRTLGEALALAVAGDVRGLGARLAALERDAVRERLDWPTARALREARARLAARGAGREELVAAVLATLALHDEHRRRQAIPTRPLRDSMPPAARLDGLLAGAPTGLRSATTVPVPGSSEALVLEAADLDGAATVLRWAVAGPAAAALARGLEPVVLTSRLAEDAWRSPLRHAALLARSEHLAGEPLAPRAGLPDAGLVALACEHQGFSLVAASRRAAVGQRGAVPPSRAVERAAALAGLAGLPRDGGPAAAVVEALWRRLVRQEHALPPQPAAPTASQPRREP